MLLRGVERRCRRGFGRVRRGLLRGGRDRRVGYRRRCARVERRPHGGGGIGRVVIRRLAHLARPVRQALTYVP